MISYKQCNWPLKLCALPSAEALQLVHLPQCDYTDDTVLLPYKQLNAILQDAQATAQY